MGQKVSRTDFEWTYTEQSHTTRRKLILGEFEFTVFHSRIYSNIFIIIYNVFNFISAKYPQIKKLFGCDPKFKWIVTMMVSVQFVMLFIMRDRSWPTIIIVAYFFGGVINHSLALGECS